MKPTTKLNIGTVLVLASTSAASGCVSGTGQIDPAFGAALLQGSQSFQTEMNQQIIQQQHSYEQQMQRWQQSQQQEPMFRALEVLVFNTRR